MNNKTTPLTKIEKKYKDKKTGEWKSLTINYAKVKDRLLIFWEENPRGLIDTTPTILDDGRVMFVAKVKTDQSEPFSRQATGSTLSSELDEKDFEKLETIAVGRALALLGYMASGEIASTEEMEEFMKFQEDKKLEEFTQVKEEVEAVKTIEELKACFEKHKGRGKEITQLFTDKKTQLTQSK